MWRHRVAPPARRHINNSARLGAVSDRGCDSGDSSSGHRSDDRSQLRMRSFHCPRCQCHARSSSRPVRQRWPAVAAEQAVVSAPPSWRPPFAPGATAEGSLEATTTVGTRATTIAVALGLRRVWYSRSQTVARAGPTRMYRRPRPGHRLPWSWWAGAAMVEPRRDYCAYFSGARASRRGFNYYGCGCCGRSSEMGIIANREAGDQVGGGEETGPTARRERHYGDYFNTAGFRVCAAPLFSFFCFRCMLRRAVGWYEPHHIAVGRYVLSAGRNPTCRPLRDHGHRSRGNSGDKAGRTHTIAPTLVPVVERPRGRKGHHLDTTERSQRGRGLVTRDWLLPLELQGMADCGCVELTAEPRPGPDGAWLVDTRRHMAAHGADPRGCATPATARKLPSGTATGQGVAQTYQIS